MHDLKRDRGMLEFTLKAFKDETVAEEGHDFAATVTGCASLALDYLTLCEHQQHMLEVAIEEHILWGQCPNGVDFGDQENCPHADSEGFLPGREVCRQCWSDYLDKKAKEGEGK